MLCYTIKKNKLLCGGLGATLDGALEGTGRTAGP